ncbi:hypothetical protein JOM56_004130 [Amanita muscaria]
MISASTACAWLQAWAILDDMLLVGIKPDVTIFNHLIHAHRHRPSPLLWKALDKMDELGISPNGITYTFLISQFTADKNLELALRYFYDMKSRGLVAQMKAVQNIVLLAAELGHPRLAIDIAIWYESQSIKQLEPSTWLSCLASSAQECFTDGVLHCWKVVVEAFGVTPDEGTCVAVLHTAARHGLPDLATDALRMLKSADVEWREYHFASVLEAFCHASKIKDALLTIDIMRTHNIPANLRTTRPILDVIGKSTDALDETWNIIEEIQKENKRVDPAVLNVLIQASLNLGDLQRAMGTYKSFKEHDASPDIDTFNTLLEGCIATKHRQLGDLLLDDMKAAKVKPNEETFERMIYVCLTQEMYEDAFFYLEEMKAAAYIPTVRVYAKIVRKCLSAGDPRYKMAIQEMREVGYAIPQSWKEEIKEYVHESSHRDLESHAGSKPARLDGAAQRFIETGGTVPSV